MSFRCAGSQEARLIRERPGFNRQSGRFVEKLYQGPRDCIYGLINECEQDGCSEWSIDHDGPVYTLTVRFSNDQSGDPETPVDEVRLHSNPSHKSIYNSPSFVSVSTADILKIRAAIQNPSSGDITGQLEGADAAELYNLLLEGVETYIIYQDILTRVRLASNTFQFSGLGPYNNVGRLLSNSTLTNDAALPSPLPFELPGTGGEETDANGVTKVYGWLKHKPEYTQAAGNKGVYTHQYEFGFWSTKLYGGLL